MNIYKLTQDIHNGYDTFDSMIVIAENKEQARNLHPQGEWPCEIFPNYRYDTSWADTPDQVKVELIGTALPDINVIQIVLSSFNAG